MADELVTLTDGTNTVNFLSGQEATTGYVKSNIEGLDPPSLKVTMSGGKPIYSSYDDREITITFGIVATDAADLTTKQTKLITILENTRLHWESRGGRGAKAQLQYRRPGGTNTSYIDVFWGECDWGRVEHQEGAAYAYSLKSAQITLTCELCFHPSAVVNLATNQAVYNHDDAGHDNYFDIVAASVKGDLPAPCNIKVVPGADFAGADVDKCWIAMVGPKADIKHWGELDMSYDSFRSNYSVIPWAATEISTWGILQATYMTLAPAEWAAMSGRVWHLLAGLYATSTSQQWRSRITLRTWGADAVEILTGDEVNHPEANQWCVVDLGPIHLSRSFAGDYSGDKLWVGVQYKADVVYGCMADFLCLVPEHIYSLFIDKAPTALAKYLFDNPSTKLYIKEATDFPHHVFTESYTGPENIGCLGSHTQGIYPRLVPGEDNRIIFLFANNGARHDLAWFFHVTLDYLPQYLAPLP